MKNPEYYNKKIKFSIPIICSLAIAWLFPTKAISQDAEFILDEVRNMQIMNWEGIQNYTVTLSMRDAMGMQAPTYYERMEVDGKPTFRVVPIAEYNRKMQIAAGFPKPEEVAAEMVQGLGMLSGLKSQGINMSALTGQIAGFFSAGAQAFQGDDGRAEAADEIADMEVFAQRARMVGTEQVVATTEEKSGSQIKHEAYHIMADDLTDVQLDQPGDGGKFTINRIDLWIDTQQMVPLMLKIAGEMERDGEVTPLIITKLDLDYKRVGSLYESHTKVHRLSGIYKAMSKKEQKEMEKAKAEFQQAKKQLASLPPDQKAMVEKMIGDKMDQVMKMLEEDNIESIMDVVSIAINEGPPTTYGMGTANSEAVLTYAGHTDGDGGIRAELVIRGTLNSMELSVGVVGNGPFPDATGNVNIIDGSGYVVRSGNKVTIYGASGTIIVLNQTDTHIAGTYDASLKYEGGVITINGEFDSGAPVGTGPDGRTQGPRGSPLPSLFGGLD